MSKNTWLINIRISAKLTQEKVADLAEIDRSYYTKIENGFIPSVKVARRIAKVLNFDWTLFFEENCAKNTQDQQSA